MHASEFSPSLVAWSVLPLVVLAGSSAVLTNSGPVPPLPALLAIGCICVCVLGLSCASCESASVGPQPRDWVLLVALPSAGLALIATAPNAAGVAAMSASSPVAFLFALRLWCTGRSVLLRALLFGWGAIFVVDVLRCCLAGVLQSFGAALCALALALPVLLPIVVVLALQTPLHLLHLLLDHRRTGAVPAVAILLGLLIAVLRLAM